MAIPASEFDELKSDLAMTMKSSWFDTGVRHWRWPQRPGRLMNRHLTVTMKSSWFDIGVKLKRKKEKKKRRKKSRIIRYLQEAGVA